MPPPLYCSACGAGLGAIVAAFHPDGQMGSCCDEACAAVWIGRNPGAALSLEAPTHLRWASAHLETAESTLRAALQSLPRANLWGRALLQVASYFAHGGAGVRSGMDHHYAGQLLQLQDRVRTIEIDLLQATLHLTAAAAAGHPVADLVRSLRECRFDPILSTMRSDVDGLLDIRDLIAGALRRVREAHLIVRSMAGG